MHLIRPGRLFWKLFLAFTLATGTSFLVGVTFVELTRPNAAPLVPAFEAPVRIAGLIQTQGIDAALPLLRKDEPVGRIALVRSDGAWVAGDRSIATNAPGLDVTDADGTRYRLRVRPSDPFDPNRTTPLLIGAFVSLFFSAGLAWYLARPLTHLSRGLRDVAMGKLTTRLRRSRRALGLDNAGGYMILEPSRNLCLQGFNFDCGPEFVEAWLEECEPGPLAI